MMKKIILGVGVATFVWASAASASEVRPAAVALAPVSVQAGGVMLPVPVKARVKKKNEVLPGFVIPLVLVVAVAGTVAAVAGGSSSPK
ncbi:hypothetical protein BH10PSE14_BH10PSE14_31680 [soil metagenome]